MALKGMQYLKDRLAVKSVRCKERYDYYEMKNSVRQYNVDMLPLSYRNKKNVLGWCAKAVDSIADRLIYRGFENDNYQMENIFNQNNADVLIDSAILSALITSCSFIYIYKDETGQVRFQAVDGRKATGIIDPTTCLLKEGYAVLEANEYGTPIIEAYFEPYKVTYYEQGKPPYTITNNCPYPTLVPIIFKPDPKRPFGHSRITRACMDIQASAQRMLNLSEISAQYYSIPQKYIIGLSESMEFDKNKANLSSFLALWKDEDEEMPQIGQFSQQSMSPFIDQMKMFASMFSGETGLTLDDLGFSTDNPSSVDAIKAQHEALRLTAKKAQKTFGIGILNTGFVGACLRDDFAYTRNLVFMTKVKWEPLFDVDFSQLSVIGDGALKINQAVPNYFNYDNLRDLTGIDKSQLQAIVQPTTNTETKSIDDYFNISTKETDKQTNEENNTQEERVDNS